MYAFCIRYLCVLSALCPLGHLFSKKNTHGRFQIKNIDDLLNLALRKLGDSHTLPIKSRPGNPQFLTHFCFSDAMNCHLVLKFCFVRFVRPLCLLCRLGHFYSTTSFRHCQQLFCLFRHFFISLAICVVYKTLMCYIQCEE